MACPSCGGIVSRHGCAEGHLSLSEVQRPSVNAPETSRQRGPWRRVTAIVLLAALALTCVTFNAGGLGDSSHRIARAVAGLWSSDTQDTDGDGLPDALEEHGWHTRDEGVIVTDPKSADSDEDGLTDGQEAGALDNPEGSRNVYVSVSSAVEFDSDGDGVGDGDEYFLDMDPRSVDTDSDGLGDSLELDCGSDPTLENADGDNYSDEEECDRGSDPLAYDLSLGEAAAAFPTGALAGDCEWCARHIFRMNDAQLQSVEYLLGQIAIGYVGIGDIRDVAADLGRLDLVDAVISAIGIAPFVGDAAKTVATLSKFAKGGDRAARAVSRLIERLPWSKSAKENALRTIFGSAVRLPLSLEGGPENVSVYKGVGYVGITNDLPLRTAQHASAGRAFTPVLITGASGLSRGEARAIEETCISQGGLSADGGVLENQRHSISPDLAYYDEAIAWGTAFLAKAGGSCS